jgi:hypothetical protein
VDAESAGPALTALSTMPARHSGAMMPTSTISAAQAGEMPSIRLRYRGLPARHRDPTNPPELTSGPRPLEKVYKFIDLKVLSPFQKPRNAHCRRGHRSGLGRPMRMAHRLKKLAERSSGNRIPPWPSTRACFGGRCSGVVVDIGNRSRAVGSETTYMRVRRGVRWG